MVRFDKDQIRCYYITMFGRLINGLIDLVYPKKCLACKNKITALSVDNLICGACWEEIERNVPPFCYSCGRHLGKENLTKSICSTCLKKKLHFNRAFSPCIYTGIIKDLIHEFKYNNKDYLGPPLSRLMIDFIKEYNLPMQYIDLLVPIPLHKTRLRQREFNQAEVLSKYIAKEFQKDLSNEVLRRNRPTKTQTELELKERLLNVKDSFTVTKPEEIKDKNILLVDDVLTTGATSSEAALALKKAGANIVFVLTLAN